MPTSLAASYGATYKLRCEHCKRDQQMASITDLHLGQVIRPANPGGDFGRCLFCKREGLKVIDRIVSDRVV